MSRLINLTAASNKFGTSHVEFILFGNHQLEIHFEEKYGRDDKFHAYLKSTVDVDVAVLFTMNNKSLDSHFESKHLTLKKDKKIDLGYVLVSVETDFHLELTVNFQFQFTKTISWFYDKNYLCFRYLRAILPVNTRPRGGSFKVAEKEDELNPFSKEDIECWNECERQNEEDRMGLCSPMQTIQHLLGVDENFELLNDVPTQFVMD